MKSSRSPDAIAVQMPVPARSYGEQALEARFAACTIPMERIAIRRIDISHAAPAWTFAIAVPAKDEERRIEACLHALGVTMDRCAREGGIVLVINNSSDRTAELCRKWMADTDLPVILIDCDLPGPSATAPWARRIAMDVARDCVTPSGFIATTDADTHVAPDWLDATCAELDRGADLVCGSVALDPIEAADVTPLMGEAGALEGQYMNLALELETVLDPDSMNPWPHHGQVSGASLAITRTSYDRAGGLPTPPFGEDRALAQAVRRDDGRIRHSDSVSIVTSCRLSGRATDGMSDSLTRRIADADAVCDEMLEPAETMLLRLRTRAALRRVWPDIAGMKAIAATVDHAPLPKGWGVGPFGAAWQILEAQTPALRRFRVRPSQLPGEIPLLRAALAEARGAAGIQGAARIDVAGKGA